MLTPQTWTVSPEFAGQTLAAFIRRQVSGVSWSQVEKEVARSTVRVNQVVCLDSARRLHAGDTIEIGPAQAQAGSLSDRVRILYVDHHLIVVDKPSGLTTERRSEERHWPARRKSLQPTLDELLPKLLSKSSTRRSRSDGGAILVHRLDRDTSGLLVVARTRQAADGLTNQFRQHTARRVYRAIVIGDPGDVTIRSRFVRDRGDGLRGSIDSTTLGKEAITHVRELERIGLYTLIECRLETGRTNQIRIHLSERNCPVCGEVKYSRRPDGRRVSDMSDAPRLALHAMELEFVHPVTRQSLRFLSPWPQDLDRWTERLRHLARSEK